MKRNTSKGMMFGVCAGIADELNVNVTMVRLAFAICTLMGFGSPIIIYIILAILMPKE